MTATPARIAKAGRQPPGAVSFLSALESSRLLCLSSCPRASQQ